MKERLHVRGHHARRVNHKAPIRQMAITLPARAAVRVNRRASASHKATARTARGHSKTGQLNHVNRKALLPDPAWIAKANASVYGNG